ncbi:MAG: hypothetical protein IPG21_10250 [Saprospiraceae bacterium]|nr:hypothetical protein [Candidatus Vicinibacter affinis]
MFLILPSLNIAQVKDADKRIVGDVKLYIEVADGNLIHQTAWLECLSEAT